MQRAIKLHFVENFSEGDTDEQLVAMRQYFKFVSDPVEADAIFCASIVKMPQALAAVANSRKPLVVYCWDYYKWAHDGVIKNFDWKKYADFLRKANLILVPSEGQKLRLKELLNLDSVVVKTGIKTYDAEVSDEGFILDPVRYYPEENRDWAEKAAHELGIPIIHSEHQFTLEEFRKLVTTCSFMTCAYREASTGGLTLMEGLWHGKPSLVSNSPYMGARSYLGDLGNYFQYDDFEDLKKKMKEMWDSRQKVDVKVAREYMEEFKFDVMAKNLCEAIRSLVKE